MKTIVAILGLVLFTMAAHAGSFSTAAWTDDASTGIVSVQTVWASHFGVNTTATVNGVSVTGVAGPTASNANFALAGTALVFNGDSSNLTALTGTGSAAIANDFVYDGNPATITLNALTVGQTYTVSFLSVGFENAGFRQVTFSSGSDSLLVDQDQFGEDNGIRVDYTFTASAATRAISIAVSNGNNATFHLYGLALRTESDPTTVTNTNDSGPGSLRWAVANAADRAGANTISFDASLNGATITLASEIVINDATGGVTIDASSLPAGLTLSGNNATRHFSVSSGKSLALIALRFTGGNAFGAAQNGNGNAIVNFGTLALTRCTLSGNTRANGSGGAILNDGGTATLTQCTLSDNSTGNGGAIFQTTGTLTLTQCTASGNRSNFDGSVIHNQLGSVTLTHCTLSGNQAGINAAIFTNHAPLTLVNSIIGGNTAATGVEDVAALGTITATGINFIGKTTGTGLAAGPAILTGDPLLSPLASNGGPTQTMAPRAGSPVMDAVTAGNEVSGLTTDQRGFPRALDGDGNGTALPDIGAFETHRTIVTTAADELDTPSSGGAGISLREALRDGGTDLITFASGFTGPIVLGSEIVVNDTTRSVEVDATTLSAGLILSGNNATRLFTVSTGSSLSFRGLTLTGGNGNGADLNGFAGAILNRGTLVLSQCTLSGNIAANWHGGAIYSFGAVTLTQCTLTGNAASQGGGAISIEGGAVTLTHCTLSGNSAYGDSGGAVSSFGTFSNASAVKMTHCTLSGNTASALGGGIYAGNSTLELTNSIIAGNTSSLGGPDIRRSGGTITPIGVNFIGEINGSTLTASSTLLTGDPLLSPLANNGGPTQTMALRPGSAAIDAATVISGLSTDQRGFSRNLDGDGNGSAAPDIGAFELGRVIVTTATDELTTPSSGGTGISLREALRDCPAHGLIDFAPSLVGQPIVLGSQLEVTKDVTIDATSLGGGINVFGNNTVRVCHIAPGVSARFVRVIIAGGFASGGFPDGYGGGVFVEGSLDLTESTLMSNAAFVGGGAYVANNGAARLTLNRSTVAFNFASYGGGIQNEGTLVCTNSTFASNQVDQDGSAISAPFSHPVTLRHCTVSLNIAVASVAATGGGLIGNAITLENSIVAGNTGLSNPNIVGTPVLIGTNLTSGDPVLSALANFGGPTLTMIPLIGSPAIDQASVLGSSPTTDQRSRPRPLGIRPDIGAVEADVIIVTTPVDELDAPGSPGAGVSLREAVHDVPAGGTITFDRAIFTGATTNTITLTKGPLNPQRVCYVDGTANPGGIKIVNTLTITQQPQPLSVATNSPAFFLVNVTAVNGGLAYQWRKNGLNIATTTSALSFASAQESDEGVYDVVVSEAPPPGLMLAFDVVISPATVTSQPASLIVDGAQVTIKRDPSSAMLALGSSYTLRVDAIGPASPALTYQWTKAGKNIGGATKSSYTITNAQLAHAGAYTCLVKSGTLLPGVTSTTAEIGVVDTRLKTVNLVEGGKFTASVSAAGNNLNYLWSNGQTAKAIAINSVAVSDSGLYSCTVTGNAGTLSGGAPTQLNVRDSVPQTVAITLPVAVIGQSYFYQVPAPPGIPITVGSNATSFSLTGALPSGMSFNSLTGVLSGRPTTTKPGGYPLVFKRINVKGPSLAMPATLTVNALPTTAVGTFAGPMARSSLNSNLGGRFDLTTNGNGTFSGGITLGARTKIGFTAKLLQSAGSGDVILYGSVPGITMADKTPLTAYIEVFATEQRAVLTLVHPNGTTLITPAWRNPWLLSKTPALNNPATGFAAKYNLRLDAGTAANTPNGYGYASFTVSTAGTLTLAGKLPDGSAVTGGSFVSKDGEIALFNLLYATNNRGSHVGQFVITPNTPVTNNVVAGTTTWSKPAPLTATTTDTVYKGGFGPLTVTAEGAPYVAPLKGAIVPGFTAVALGGTNAKFSFTLGGLDTEAKEFQQLARIYNPSATGLTNIMTIAAPVLNKTIATGLTASNGEFTINFTIAGASPTLNRVAPCYGKLVKIGATTQGYGFFLLPTATAKISTSPKLSGRVVLGVP